MKRPPAWLLTVLSWIVATALLALCFRGVDRRELIGVLETARLPWLLLGVLLNGATLGMMAVQWQIFLPRGSVVAYLKTLKIVAVMAMVANSVPFMAGEAAGVHLLATRGGTGHATAASVTAMRMLAEGLTKVAMLIVLARVAPLPPPLRHVLFGLAAGVAVLLALVMAAAWSHGRIHLPTERHGPVGAVARFFREWAAGLEGARRPSILAWGVAAALAMKGAELTALMAVQSAFGIALPVRAALGVLAAVSVSTMVSVAPGNLGVYEGSAFLAYRSAGLARNTALALSVLQHVVYLVPMAGCGWLVLLSARMKRRRTR